MISVLSKESQYGPINTRSHFLLSSLFDVSSCIFCLLWSFVMFHGFVVFGAFFDVSLETMAEVSVTFLYCFFERFETAFE